MPLFKFHGEPLEAAPRNTTPDLIELLRVTWRNGRGHEADNSEELDETGEAEEPEEEQDIVCVSQWPDYAFCCIMFSFSQNFHRRLMQAAGTIGTKGISECALCGGLA